MQQFHKNSNIPELTLGVDYKADGWIAGVGIDMLSIVPRTQSKWGDKTYKVDERLTTLSYEAHVKYTNEKLYFAAKSTLGSNMTHVSMTGGYGIKSVDSKTGERKYTAFRNSSTWVNIAYGKKCEHCRKDKAKKQHLPDPFEILNGIPPAAENV